MTTINLTQHNATPDQQNAGVVEPTRKDTIKESLTFTGDVPDANIINDKAE